MIWNTLLGLLLLLLSSIYDNHIFYSIVSDDEDLIIEAGSTLNQLHPSTLRSGKPRITCDLNKSTENANETYT